MARILPSLATLLLCSTALAGCDTLGASSGASDKAALEKQVHEAPPADVATGVRQARDLRLAGKYDDATRILSQMMLVASDDPRVVGEYGKTLLQRGRTQDAVQFLSRAVQIESGDWTTYSALGVAYDQLGDQGSAKGAYEHALALQPNEASVLSNYALSRMLANDLKNARLLAARAASAGGAADPKIAGNIAMIEATAPPQPVAMEPVSPPVASAAPVQKTVASAAQVRIVPDAGNVPSGAPRVLMPATASNTLPAGTQPYSGVVMQTVPVDPLAGPVQASAKNAGAPTKLAVKTVPKHTVKHALHAPQAVAKTSAPTDETKTAVNSDTTKSEVAKVEAVKISAPVKAAAVTAPVKPVADKVSEPAKAAAIVAPVKAVAVATPVKPVAGKTPEPIKAAAAAAPIKAAAVTAPAKPGTDKTAPVKVAVAAPVKGQAVADKTPAAVKAVAAKQDGVPALRLAADASTP